MKTHLCLVSRQTLPNFLPVLDEDQKPDKVILVVTPEMKTGADHLETALKDVGCRTERISIPDAYNTDEIEKTVFDVLAGFSEKDSVMLNATGGTKLMMAAAYSVFREVGYPVFYIDTNNERRIDLVPVFRTKPFSDLVKVKGYLKVYGYQLASGGNFQVTPEVLNLAKLLIGNVKKYERVLGALNDMAQKAKKGFFSEIPQETAKNENFAKLIGFFADAKLLVRAGNRLVFADEKTRQLVNGGWLEQYLLHVARDLKKEGKIFDYHCNAKIVSSGGSENELDLVFTARNRLHIVECKTKNMIANTGKADDATYKLEGLRNLVGGTFGRAMLVSYRQLREEDRRRCKEYNIEVVEGSELSRLREKIIKWIRSH